MKNIKNLLIVAAIVAIGFTAYGQRGLDAFAVSRSIVLATPTTLTVSATATVTNGPIDTHGFDGIACVDLFGITNAAGACTARLETSPDTTNWTAMTLYATATSYSLSFTNLMYGTNVTATQTSLVPGTITTPTAATAGWATPFVAPALFTNTAATLSVQNGFQKVGYNVADAARYLHIIWTPTGAGTNVTVGALFTGYGRR